MNSKYYADSLVGKASNSLGNVCANVNSNSKKLLENAEKLLKDVLFLNKENEIFEETIVEIPKVIVCYRDIDIAKNGKNLCLSQA